MYVDSKHLHVYVYVSSTSEQLLQFPTSGDLYRLLQLVGAPGLQSR